jgi:hypothetical protein
MAIAIAPEGKLSLNRPLFMVAVNERYLNVSFLAALIINQWSRKVSKSKVRISIGERYIPLTNGNANFRL